MFFKKACSYECAYCTAVSSSLAGSPASCALHIVPRFQVLCYVVDLVSQLYVLSLVKAAVRKTHRFRGFNSNYFLLTACRWQLLFLFCIPGMEKGRRWVGKKKAGRVRGWEEEGETVGGEIDR